MAFVIITTSVLCILVLSNILLWCIIKCINEKLDQQEPSKRSQKLFTYTDGDVVKHNVVKSYLPKDGVIRLVLKDGSKHALPAKNEYSFLVQEEEL